MRADYDYVHTHSNRVMVTSGGLERFASKWPCSGMRFDADIAVEFEYAADGDLVDIHWFDCSDGADALDISEPAGVNGEALLALSQDAQAFLNTENMRLRSVHYGT
jgi:hypothetical protein